MILGGTRASFCRIPANGRRFQPPCHISLSTPASGRGSHRLRWWPKCIMHLC